MTARSGALLERESELRTIATVLQAARDGAGQLALVEAGPGLGKSSLLEHAAELGAEAGMLVLRASGGEHERALPFGGALQLFEPMLRRASERAQLLAGSATLATALFDPQVIPELQATEDRALSTVHGLFWLLVNLCEPAGESADTARRPGLLLIDDAHLLDVASLRFLVYLARRLDQLAVCVLIAARPGSSDACAELETLRAGVRTWMRPGQLSVGAVGRVLAQELGGGPVAPEFAGECERITGGNPFLVRELAVELRAEGIEPRLDSLPRVSGLAPGTVVQAVVARLARLGPAAGTIAKLVAVLERDATVRLVSALAQLGQAAVSATADRLVAAGVFAAGEPLRFAHALIADAVESVLPAGWRAQIELEAARLLSSEGAPNERVAAHLLRAAAGGDSWVCERLASCAREARALGAPDVAAAYLHRALAEPPQPEQRVELLGALAEAEALSGAPEALRHLEQALVFITEPAERMRFLTALGRLLWARGRQREATEAFEQALAHSEHGEPAAVRELRARLWVAAHQAGASFSSLEDQLQELELPDGAELPSERIVLALLAAHQAASGAAVAQYLPLTMRALEGNALLEELSLDHGMLLISGSFALLHADELDRALALLDDALQQARRDGSVLAAATVSYLRTWPEYFSGRIRDAIADAEQALAARELGWSMHAGAACAILAHARIERGDLDGARAVLDVARSLELPADAAEHSLLLVASGQVRLLDRDPAGAIADLIEAGRRDDALGVSGRPIAWRVLAVEALVALDDRERAVELADDEHRRAHRIGAPRTLGMALRVAGLARGGRAGLELLEQSAAILARSPSQLECARTLVDLGSLQRRVGERVASRRTLRRGLELAERCGAVLLVQRARQELRVAGARPRRVARRGVDSLTASEHRVAELAATGLTNREIAQTLFVTPKAVEFHMRNVFQKLDIGSRKELPGLLAHEKRKDWGHHPSDTGRATL